MAKVTESERTDFFAAVAEASAKAIWCALATNAEDGPRVRMVHPTWEGEVLWFATGTASPKVHQIRQDPRVDIQFQVAPPDFVHIMVRGRAEVVTDDDEKKRVWDLIDYDLSQFWPSGHEDPNYTLVRIAPRRVELAKMFGAQDQQVWRAE